jgi:peptidoglycan/LPS O-acetylase OafA/YrhL
VQFVSGSAWRYTVLGVFNANYAVDMFFVLSGFVLTNMISGFSVADYSAYLGRRLIRLYPMLWAALLLGLVAFEAVSSPCSISPWVCHFIKGPSSALDFVRDAIPGGNYGPDPVMWTIRIEVAASIAYPIMLFLWRYANGVGKIALSVAALALPFVSPNGFSHYAFLFLAGIALNDIRTLWRPWVLLSAGVALMLVSGFLVRGHSAPADLVAGASAAMLIAVVVYACPQWIGTALDNRGALKLGELSYSYYLLNPIVLWVIARVADRPLSAFLAGGGDGRAALVATGLMLSAAALGVALAQAANLAVEKPSIRLSRRAEKWILQALGRREAQPA